MRERGAYMDGVAENWAPSDRRARPARDVLLARWLLLALLAVNVAGMSSLWLYQTYTAARAATSDLQSRVDQLTKSPSVADLLNGEKLSAYSTALLAADADVRKLDSLIPFQGGLGPTISIHHALVMAEDLVAAARQLVSVAVTVQPEVQALLQSIAKPPASSGTQGVTQGVTPVLTPQVLSSVTQRLVLANAAWTQALSERKFIQASDLELLPVKNAATYLGKLNAVAPKIRAAFSEAFSVLAGLPTVLGLAGPANFLLFDMDSDELRATGGYLGNYAQLTVSQGLLTSGIHLHDIYTLDCPGSSVAASSASTCPSRPNPQQYAWFKADVAGNGATHFGLRDSNLDPDLPASAALMAQMYRADGGPAVQGIILLTPAFIADLLKGIGPLAIAQFHETITASNLKDKIHYYHQNPQIGEELGVSAAALGTSPFKVFDVLLSKALIAKLSSLSPKQLLALGPSLQQALAQKDVQVFSTNPDIESLIEQANVAGRVQSAPDSLFVVDTNDGGSYANADVTESVTDAVTLDSGLGATHALTLAYGYPSAAHSYSQVDQYTDFVRVILPSTAQRARIDGSCVPEKATQAGHIVLGCHMYLLRGQQIVLRASWYTPPSTDARTGSGRPSTYQFLIQRQAGAQVQVHLSIVAPAGKMIRSIQPGAVLRGEATWGASQLLTDTTVTVTLH
jgi:hypothetical protein